MMRTLFQRHQRRTGKAALGGILLLLVSGCINLGIGGNKDTPAITNFVLDDLGRPAVSRTPKPLTLVVLDTQASAFYDADALAYSDRRGTRAYYQYAHWTERPGTRLTDLITLRLDREPLFTTVVGDTDVRGDWSLETELLEFYHDATQRPGEVRVELSADVVDLASHTLVGHKLFSVTDALATYDAAGAHDSFNRATTRLLSELTDWLASLSKD
ncbi:MAG: ABC-type transport auxiliary lipoprotein family protein [Thiobacillaceae bacterium]